MPICVSRFMWLSHVVSMRLRQTVNRIALIKGIWRLHKLVFTRCKVLCRDIVRNPLRQA